MWNEFVPGETGFIFVWVFSVERLRNHVQRTCVMEAKQWNHMLTAVGRVGQPSVSNTSLDTKLRCNLAI